MMLRENNLKSFVKFTNAAIVHLVAETIALDALVARTRRTAGKMPALLEP